FFKAGALIDAAALDRLKPAAEIYTYRRVGWCLALEGAQQKEKMWGTDGKAGIRRSS
ncbi:uncharacterized protein CLUP02_10013, partial [Colletotrichum lupini]